MENQQQYKIRWPAVVLDLSKQNFYLCNFLFVEVWICLHFIQSKVNYTIFSICFYTLLKISHPTAQIIKFAVQFFILQKQDFYSLKVVESKIFYFSVLSSKIHLLGKYNETEARILGHQIWPNHCSHRKIYK